MNQMIDRPGQLGVDVQFLFLSEKVVICLAPWNSACRFWPIITKVDKKIASSDTTRVSVGQGLRSSTIIHTVNATTA